MEMVEERDDAVERGCQLRESANANWEELAETARELVFTHAVEARDIKLQKGKKGTSWR